MIGICGWLGISRHYSNPMLISITKDWVVPVYSICIHHLQMYWGLVNLDKGMARKRPFLDQESTNSCTFATHLRKISIVYNGKQNKYIVLKMQQGFNRSSILFQKPLIPKVVHREPLWSPLLFCIFDSLTLGVAREQLSNGSQDGLVLPSTVPLPGAWLTYGTLYHRKMKFCQKIYYLKNYSLRLHLEHLCGIHWVHTS